MSRPIAGHSSRSGHVLNYPGHWAGLGLHWAFLIVFFLYVLIAAVLGLIGSKQVKQVKAPERAISQGREIPAALKGQS